MTQLSAPTTDLGVRATTPVDLGPRLHDALTATDPRSTWLAARRWVAARRPLRMALDGVVVLVCALVLRTTDVLSPFGVLIIAVTWPLVLAGSQRTAHPLGGSFAQVTRRIAGSGLRVSILVAACAPLLAGGAPRNALLALVAASATASLLLAMCLDISLTARLVVVGHPLDLPDALAELTRSGQQEVVAVCLSEEADLTAVDTPTFVGLESSPLVAVHHGAQAIVVLPGRHLTPSALRRVQWQAAEAGVALYVGTGLLDVDPCRTRVLTASGLDMLHVAPPVLRGPRRLLKDVVERALALVGLLLLLPLLTVVAVAICATSPGPALFRQVRLGRHGRPFSMVKFRSMHTDAEMARAALAHDNEGAGVLFKLRQDPRITPVGHWLRRYSIDELPQLWNVVRGDMSLVGPRPALPAEVAAYEGGDVCRRMVVKPGVTGLWQVSGRSDLSWDESVRLDLRYVDNWSLRLDAQILARTVNAVLGHRGAY